MAHDQPNCQGNGDGVFACKSKDEVEFFIEDAFSRAGLDTKRGIKDDPLSQLYLSIASHLNDQLETILGGPMFDVQRSVQGASPAEVADAIMQQCNAHFPLYKRNSNHLANSTAWMHYLTYVQTGLNQGISEATDIIESLGGLSPRTRATIARLKEHMVKKVSQLRHS